ncbi:hypothetical protein [Nocardia tengchongensis]
MIQVGLEFGGNGQGLEKESAERVVSVVDRAAEPEQDIALAQVGQDLSGFSHIASESVELRRGQHNLPPGNSLRCRGHCGERVVEARAVLAGGAGEPGVDEDPFTWNAEREQLVGLDLDVLSVGGATAVSDADGSPIPGHGQTWPLC